MIQRYSLPYIVYMVDDFCVRRVLQRFPIDLQDLVRNLQVCLIGRGAVQLHPLVVGLHQNYDVAAEVHHLPAQFGPQLVNYSFLCSA